MGLDASVIAPSPIPTSVPSRYFSGSPERPLGNDTVDLGVCESGDANANHTPKSGKMDPPRPSTATSEKPKRSKAGPSVKDIPQIDPELLKEAPKQYGTITEKRSTMGPPKVPNIKPGLKPPVRDRSISKDRQPARSVSRGRTSMGKFFGGSKF